jgi:putative endonuclease
VNRQQVGSRGETIARRFLQRRGFRVIDRNWRTRSGEIDLVCRDRDTLVFVEVKARSGIDFGQPYEAVGTQKQARLRRLAEEYIAGHALGEFPVRFDVLSVRLDSEPGAVEHIEGAF